MPEPWGCPGIPPDTLTPINLEVLAGRFL